LFVVEDNGGGERRAVGDGRPRNAALQRRLDRVTPARIALERLKFRVARRLLRPSPLRQAARRSWTIAPAHRLTTQASLFLPAQVETIRRLDPCTAWEIERRRIFGGAFEMPAVQAFEYADAALYRGAIVCRGRQERIRPHGAPDPRGDGPLDVPQGALAGTYLGLQYFGHWLRDDAALSELARECGEPISPTPPDWPHIAGYVDLLGLSWRTAETVRFQTLVMFDDEEYTRSKGERLSSLRARLRGRTPQSSGRRVFLRRGAEDQGPRRFGNENEIAGSLASLGFLVLDLISSSVEEIARALAGAELVVGVEGSHLAHATYFLKEGGGLLAITSPDRFATGNKRWTDLLGMRYGFLVGDPSRDGFTADFDDLRRAVDLFD
jgi:hypothetical protein